MNTLLREMYIYLLLIFTIPQSFPSFDAVVLGLAWSRGPESYAGGTVATGRASHDGQV